MLKIISIITFTLALTSCNGIRSGRVTSIYAEPPHNELVLKTGYVTNGGVTYMWVNEWIGDTTYHIYYSNGKEENSFKTIKEAVWLYHIGDTINF